MTQQRINYIHWITTFHISFVCIYSWELRELVTCFITSIMNIIFFVGELRNTSTICHSICLLSSGWGNLGHFSTRVETLEKNGGTYQWNKNICTVWWFRNPKANHLICLSNPVNNGISTTSTGELNPDFWNLGCSHVWGSTSKSWSCRIIHS